MQESYYVVNDCKRFIEINVEVKKISGAVRKVDEETFIEMLNEKKMEAQIEGYREVWINKDLKKNILSHRLIMIRKLKLNQELQKFSDLFKGIQEAKENIIES